jgi:hypothetical protein
MVEGEIQRSIHNLLVGGGIVSRVLYCSLRLGNAGIFISSADGLRGATHGPQHEMEYREHVNVPESSTTRNKYIAKYIKHAARHGTTTFPPVAQ